MISLEQAMKNGFNGIDKDYDHTCPVCHEKIYHMHGNPIASDGTIMKDIKVDFYTNCRCQDEEERKNIIERANLKLNKQNIDYNIRSSGMKPLHLEMANKEMKASENTAIFRKILNYSYNFDTNEKGMMITGNTGTGKTMIACKVLKNVILNGHTGIFVEAFNIYDNIRDTFSNPFRSTEEYISKLEAVDLLIIDDLGTEVNSESSVNYLTRIIDNRATFKKKTIITTNLNPKELKDRYGDRFYSRCFEYFLRIPITGKDNRVTR